MQEQQEPSASFYLLVSRISVILPVSLPPISKALSPFYKSLWMYAAPHVSPQIALCTFDRLKSKTKQNSESTHTIHLKIIKYRYAREQNEPFISEQSAV